MEEVAFIGGKYKPINTKDKINDIIVNGKSVVKNKIADLSNVLSGKLDVSTIEEAKIVMDRAKEAIEGAEKCNITMTDSVVTLTDRNGKTSIIDVAMQSETVNVTVTSGTTSIKTTGLTISVFINNGKIPVQYTTDSEGKVTFTVPRGNYYQIELPEFAAAQPITPIGYTAILENRDISINYTPYDSDNSEKIIVQVNKVGDNNVKTPWAGKEIKITYNNQTIVYTTDSNGQYSMYIPFGKEYTVTVEDTNSYFVDYGLNNRTYTAKVKQRQTVFNLSIYSTGIFLIGKEEGQYNIQEWIKAGYTKDDVVAIRISTNLLAQHRGTFMIPISVLINMSCPSYQWCNQNIQFDCISANGNTTTDPYYYTGEDVTSLVIAEAKEKSYLVPAFTWVYDQVFTINGVSQHGYIGSIGQMTAFINNLSYIRDNIIGELWSTELASKVYSYFTSKWKWTCNQNYSNAWSCSTTTNSNGKNGYNLVVPFCAS